MAIQNTVSIHVTCQGNALSAAVYSGTNIAFAFDEFLGLKELFRYVRSKGLGTSAEG